MLMRSALVDERKGSVGIPIYGITPDGQRRRHAGAAGSVASIGNAAAGAAIGTLGIIIGGIVLAGLGLKFSAVLIDRSGGYLFAALCLATFVSIIIGMGLSTIGSYIILSVVAAPALIKSRGQPAWREPAG